MTRCAPGKEEGLLCDLERAWFHVSAGPGCGPAMIVGVLEGTNCGSAVALISVVAFDGSESLDLVVPALATYDGAH